MLKILIVCKNNSTAKNIVNNVISKIPDLRLIGVANTIPEGKYFIEKHEPNLIITTSQNFLKFLNEYNYYYTPGVVFISQQGTDSNIQYKIKKLFLFITPQENFRMIHSKTLKFIAKNYTTSKKDELREIIKDIGFDFKLTGTVFLLDTLIYITTFQNAQYFENLISDIYPFVARKHRTTPQIVKWSIERTIKYLYQKHEKETFEIIEDYFGIKAPEKITPKTLIASIIEIFQEY